MKASLAAATAAACLLLTACGSDDSAKDATGKPETLSKAELIEQGDAVCRAGNERMEVISAKFEQGDLEDEAFLAEVNEEIVAELRTQASELRALQPSPAEAPAYDRMLDELDAVVARSAADPSALYATPGNPFEKANRLAVELGFEVCGEDGPS